MIRQPILSVLGHIDHGKTTLLDYIRGSTVTEREAGKVTQHIGATEIPNEKIYEMCGPMLPRKRLDIPGLLFIDTPGHRAFTSLRERGGAIADLAILVIDINEGVKSETKESIEILKKYRTPFIIAANKIDLIDGWHSSSKPFLRSYEEQSEYGRDGLDKKFYELIAQLYDAGVPTERYDKIKDFTKNFAAVPISAKSGEGIPDLLMTLIGIAQKFLKGKLEIKKVDGEGSILEVREEKSLGLTLNIVLYDGVLRKGDRIAIASISKEPIKTRIKALFLPSPMSEMRDKKTRFREVDEVKAACGVKIIPQDKYDIIPGMPFKVYTKEETSLQDMRILVDLNLDSEGVVIRADTMGSIEAIFYELKQLQNYKVMKAEVGDVSRKDVVECASNENPKYRTILAFNVKVLDEARQESKRSKIEIIGSNLLFDLINRYEEFVKLKEEEIERAKRGELTYPASLKVLQGYVFRLSKPAIVGTRITGGVLTPGRMLINSDGEKVGKIACIQSTGKNLKEARLNEEVAISVDKGVVGKNLKEEEILYADMNERSARELLNSESLTFDESETLQKIVEIKRKKEPFWAM